MAVNTCPCGTTFEGYANKRYCSERCKKRAQRSGGPGRVVEAPPPVEPERLPDRVLSVESATRAELERAGRLGTPVGQACLVLARQLDEPGANTASAVAAAARELRATLAEATRGSAKATSPQKLADELAERRAKRGA